MVAHPSTVRSACIVVRCGQNNLKRKFCARDLLEKEAIALQRNIPMK